MKMTEKKRGFIMRAMRDWIKVLEFLDFVAEKISFFSGMIFISVTAAVMMAAPSLLKLYTNPDSLNVGLVNLSGGFWNILVVVGIISYILSVVLSVIRVAIAFPDSSGRMDALKGLLNDLLLLAAVVTLVYIVGPMSLSLNPAI